MSDMSGNDERPPTSDALRDRIDRGKGQDKVAFPDPAAAPLGTDAEAGGHSPTEAELETAHHHEVEARGSAAPPTAPAQTRDLAHQDRPAIGGFATVVIGLVAAAIAAILFLWIG